MFPPGLDRGPQADANVANHTEPLAYTVLCVNQREFFSLGELHVLLQGDTEQGSLCPKYR